VIARPCIALMEVTIPDNTAVFGFIKHTWRYFFKGLRFRTVLNQIAHRYNLCLLLAITLIKKIPERAILQSIIHG
jgi:hypothetical protein